MVEKVIILNKVMPSKIHQTVRATLNGAKRNLLTMTGDPNRQPHFPSETGDLLDLVNSYLEKGIEIRQYENSEGVCQEDGDEAENNIMNILNQLLDDQSHRNIENQAMIRSAVEKILQERASSRQDKAHLNLELVRRLRAVGFDAGLCKTKWKKSGKEWGGNYEYVDIIFKRSNKSPLRYIIVVNLSEELGIARPSPTYSSLLGVLPNVFVGRPGEMKQLLRVMSQGISESMKINGLQLPPWRRGSYMELKWFSPYERTTNEVASSQIGSFNFSVNNISKELPTKVFSKKGRCRHALVDGGGFNIGYLTMAFGSTDT